jgi:hypothetical protein
MISCDKLLQWLCEHYLNELKSLRQDGKFWVQLYIWLEAHINLKRYKQKRQCNDFSVNGKTVWSLPLKYQCVEHIVRTTLYRITKNRPYTKAASHVAVSLKPWRRTTQGSKRSRPPRKTPRNAQLYVLLAKKNNTPDFQYQRCINSYYVPLAYILHTLSRIMRIFLTYLFAGRFWLQRDSM